MTASDHTPIPLWARVPMGPVLSKFLEVDKVLNGASPTADMGPGAEAQAVLALTQHLRALYQVKPPLSPDLVVDLMDELVTMAIPEAALDVARAYPEALQETDFRAQLALGVGAMMHGDLALSESALRKAQASIPHEPAPYINLAQIFLSQGRLDEAEVWCLAGIDAELNSHRLWELLAMVYREQMGDYMPEHLLKVADKHTSWAGVALGCSLIATGDRYLKASHLEKFYFQGERDPAFLIELTGAYGIAGDHERIPPIVWQAEQLATKGLPWQLHAHAAQAQLALGHMDEFRVQLGKARQDAFLPEDAALALKELELEAESGILH